MSYTSHRFPINIFGSDASVRRWRVTDSNHSLFTRDNPVVNPTKIKARCVEPMDCLPVAKQPEGPVWTGEIKLDGWRMELLKARR